MFSLGVSCFGRVRILLRLFAMTGEEIGIVGLGRMGANLARQAVEHEHRVVGFSKDPPPDELRAAGVTIPRSPRQSARRVPRAGSPRIPGPPRLP